jgi:hypothetical protein
MKLRLMLCAAFLSFSSLTAHASCYGSSDNYRCNDASGNSYHVTKRGDTTRVEGYNAETGNFWNQSSRTVGNRTYQEGQAANGNLWSQTIESRGGVTNYSGIDSEGNSFYKTCTASGCY